MKGSDVRVVLVTWSRRRPPRAGENAQSLAHFVGYRTGTIRESCVLSLLVGVGAH